MNSYRLKKTNLLLLIGISLLLCGCSSKIIGQGRLLHIHMGFDGIDIDCESTPSMKSWSFNPPDINVDLSGLDALKEALKQPKLPEGSDVSALVTGTMSIQNDMQGGTFVKNIAEQCKGFLNDSK